MQTRNSFRVCARTSAKSGLMSVRGSNPPLARPSSNSFGFRSLAIMTVAKGMQLENSERLSEVSLPDPTQTHRRLAMVKQSFIKYMSVITILLFSGWLSDSQASIYAKTVNGEWQLANAGGFSQEAGGCRSDWACVCPKHPKKNCHYLDNDNQSHVDYCEKYDHKHEGDNRFCAKCPKPTPPIEFGCSCIESCS